MSYWQAPIKPHAPWLAFIGARSRLLSAFHAFERATREGPGPPPCADAEDKNSAVSKAFVQFSLALDRITVPHAYWSDLPHEDVADGASHSVVIGRLNDLEKQFKLLASQRALPSFDDSNTETALDGLLETLEKETELFASSSPCHLVARTQEGDTPQWPHDGSICRP
ncbi:hypothetical protein JCM11251_007800 [Rhodosporidiobolus azoricus]